MRIEKTVDRLVRLERDGMAPPMDEEGEILRPADEIIHVTQFLIPRDRLSVDLQPKWLNGWNEVTIRPFS